jgi:hypothetical protein
MTVSEAKRWQNSPDPSVRAAARARLAARTARSRRTAPRKAPGREAKEAKRKTKAERRREVYAAVDARAEGGCEVVTAGPRDDTGREHDHFWGRGKAPETAETVWLMCPDCHRKKTLNKPDRATWIRAFKHHALKHGYLEQVAKCDRALALEAAQHPTPPAPEREETTR